MKLHRVGERSYTIGARGAPSLSVLPFPLQSPQTAPLPLFLSEVPRLRSPEAPLRRPLPLFLSDRSHLEELRTSLRRLFLSVPCQLFPEIRRPHVCGRLRCVARSRRRRRARRRVSGAPQCCRRRRCLGCGRRWDGCCADREARCLSLVFLDGELLTLGRYGYATERSRSRTRFEAAQNAGLSLTARRAIRPRAYRPRIDHRLQCQNARRRNRFREKASTQWFDAKGTKGCGERLLRELPPLLRPLVRDCPSGTARKGTPEIAPISTFLKSG
jgi:hypothetical protein